MDAHHFNYTPEMGRAQRKKFKNDELRNHPDTLYVDKRTDIKPNNLIFFTNNPDAWQTAIIGQFPETKIIQQTEIRLKLPSGQGGTARIYSTNKIVIYGSEDALDAFHGVFKELTVQIGVQQLTLEGGGQDQEGGGGQDQEGEGGQHEQEGGGGHDQEGGVEQEHNKKEKIKKEKKEEKIKKRKDKIKKEKEEDNNKKENDLMNLMTDQSPTA